MKNKIFMFILSYPICIVFLIVFKVLLNFGIDDLGSWAFEKFWMIFIPILSPIITILLIKVFKISSIIKTYLIFFILCIISMFIFVRFSYLYVSHRIPTYEEEIQSIEKEINSAQNAKDMEFMLVILNRIYYSSSNVKYKDNEIRRFLESKILFPDELKSMPVKELISKFSDLNSYGYELVKIGPNLFEIRKKTEKK